MDEQRAEFEAWAKQAGWPHHATMPINKGPDYFCDMSLAVWQAATQRQQERISYVEKVADDAIELGNQQAIRIAELEAQVTALTLETERTARNRDMWKGQTQRQADRLHDLHTCMAAIKRLLARDPCAHANTAIQMIDAAIAAGKGEG